MRIRGGRKDPIKTVCLLQTLSIGPAAGDIEGRMSNTTKSKEIVRRWWAAAVQCALEASQADSS